MDNGIRMIRVKKIAQAICEAPEGTGARPLVILS
jgi:hypothetical protein